MSIDVGLLTDNMLPIASTIFNSMAPIIGITAGITLAVGLGAKITEALRRAF